MNFPSLMKSGFKFLALSGFLCATASAQSSYTKGGTPWPDIPAPPKSEVQWVSDDMRVNGLPMKVQIFQSQASKDEVVKYYLAYWGIDLHSVPNKAKPPEGMVTQKGDETLVSRPHGPFYSQVKVRERGLGSEGTLATTQLVGAEPRIDGSGVPSPRSATAVNVVEAIDNGKRNKTVLFLTRDSLGSVAEFYQTQMQSRGWSLAQEQIGEQSAGRPSAIVRSYIQANQQLDVSIGIDAARGLSVINANLITMDK